MKPTHVMIDLETLGTVPGSVILSIGACVFDESGPSADPDNRFEVHIRLDSSVAEGGAMEPGTVLWWMDPKRDAARLAMLAGQVGAKRAPQALVMFHDWLLVRQADPKRRIVWGKGPSFDCGLLAAAFRKSRPGGALPWIYPNERCVRTLVDMAPHVPEPVREGTHHSALDDALHQARHCGAILRALRAEPVFTPEGA